MKHNEEEQRPADKLIKYSYMIHNFKAFLIILIASSIYKLFQQQVSSGLTSPADRQEQHKLNFL